MSEKLIEQHLRNQIKNLGGIAFKFVSPGNAGVPDRIILLPTGRVVFVELKAPGKKSTALQTLQQERIENLGFQVLILDSKEQVDEFVRGL